MALNGGNEGELKLAEAFLYFYFIGAGTAAGVASVAWIAWKVVQRSNKGKKETKKRKAVV